MAKKLKIPLTEKQVKELKIGDIVYLDGIIYTARDEAHLHALEYYEKGKKLPVEFRGNAVFHCGPIMKKEKGKWKLVASGPTTSSRMNSLEPKFIEIFRPSCIIGKGGMNEETKKAMEKFSCVYLAITGGTAVLSAKGIKEVIGVHWEELGMPEALWILNAENLGPLIVGIDAHGNSIYEGVSKKVQENLIKIREKLLK